MNRAFTLVEIMIVLFVISTLTGLGIMSFSQLRKQADDNKRNSDIASIEAGLEKYLKDNNEYPAGQVNNTTDGPGIIDFYQKYLPNTIKDPLDDFTQYPDWRYTIGGVATPICWYGREPSRPTTRCQGYGYLSTRSSTTSWGTSLSYAGCSINTSSLSGSSWYILSWYSAEENRILFKKKVAYGNPTITLSEGSAISTIRSTYYPDQTCTFV